MSGPVPTRICFIGNMGWPMAARLVRAGFVIDERFRMMRAPRRRMIYA